METQEDFTKAQVRKFLTVLFVNRARRHLKTLAEHYGWSPDTLETHTARFIQVGNCVPHFATTTEWLRTRMPERDEDDDGDDDDA